MTDTDATGAEALEQRIRELESENARLSGATAPERASRPRGGRWRPIVSAICIVVASILVPVSIVSAWARIQLVDEDAFVATLAPLASDPAVQDMIIDETMEAVNANVDFHELTASVFDGISDLGLPPRAVQVLGMLQAPAADGIENLVHEAVTRVVVSDAFADVWATATRGAHRALTTAATSDGGGLVVRTDEGVGIQVGVLVDTVKQRLLDRGVSAAQLIPAVDHVVIIGKGDNLAMIRTGYALATTIGWWLPVISLALFGLGIAIARRRSTAVLGTGLGLAIGAGALAATLSIGNAAVQIVAGDLELSPSGLEVIYGQLVAAMTQTAVVLSLLGVFVAVLGWVMGGSAPAQGARGAVRGMNSSARKQLASRGFDTGGFGGWLARYKVLVRTVIAVLAVLWLFALRPLSIGDVLLVIVVAFAVAWILELLQRRAEEHADAAEPADVVADTEVVAPEPEERADAATAVAAASDSTAKPKV